MATSHAALITKLHGDSKASRIILFINVGVALVLFGLLIASYLDEKDKATIDCLMATFFFIAVVLVIVDQFIDDHRARSLINEHIENG
jgi:hypothetical protein